MFHGCHDYDATRHSKISREYTLAHNFRCHITCLPIWLSLPMSLSQKKTNSYTAIAKGILFQLSIKPCLCYTTCRYLATIDFLCGLLMIKLHMDTMYNPPPLHPLTHALCAKHATLNQPLACLVPKQGLRSNNKNFHMQVGGDLGTSPSGTPHITQCSVQ